MYRALFELNHNFEQISHTLQRLIASQQLSARQLRPYTTMVQETRAALSSHLTGILETRETELAGLWQRRRSRGG